MKGVKNKNAIGSEIGSEINRKLIKPEKRKNIFRKEKQKGIKTNA